MSYIGNTPFTAAFLTDTFSGNGSTVAFTMSVAPANTSSILVAVTGVVQDPSTYSVSGTTLTFSAAPPSGTSNISVRYLGIPASGVTTTAYRTVTDTTATAGQTTFTIPSYTVGYVDVYRNGLLLAAADYTATTGTTVVLASAASAGDTITTESFYVSSVLNAIQQYNGLSVNQILTTPTANTLTSASGSNLQLQTNGGTTALTLDTSGNAGLGVTPSAWQVASGRKAIEIGSAGNGLYGYSNSNFNMSAGAYFNGTNWIYSGTDAPSYYNQNGSTHSWYIAPSGTAGNAISFTKAMTIDASGNLGVGTTSPTTAGGVAVAIYDSSSPRLRLTNSTTGNTSSVGCELTANGSDFVMENRTSSANIRFYNNGSERARIDSSGNLLVGATSGSARGYFTQDGTGSSIQTGQTNTSFTGTAVNIRATRNTSNGTYNFIGCAREGVADVFFVRDSGNVVNANNSYGAISDIKLKENILDATPKLAGLMQVRVVNYNFKNEPEHKQLGVIAQEIEQVFPAMVEETIDRDSEGNDLGTTTKSVKYSVFVPMLIKAIQEQQAIITQLQADVAALKGQA